MLATDWLAGHFGLERARLVSDASLGIGTASHCAMGCLATLQQA